MFRTFFLAPLAATLLVSTVYAAEHPDLVSESPVSSGSGSAVVSTKTPLTLVADFPAKAAEVVMQSMSLIGTPYRFGGATPGTGLDCSGLVRYVFLNSFGKILPRSSAEMIRFGVKIPSTEMRSGDLVFYASGRGGISHVGIYIGANRFIHAPSTGGSVRIDSIDNDYWKRHFVGARRIVES